MKRIDHLRPADAERRARILRVAEQEFLQEGLEGCSIDRIAAKASVSKREVYRYFSSKTALFEAVARDIFIRASRTMAATRGTGRGTRAVLLRYARGVLSAYDKTHLQLLRTAIAAGRHFAKLAAELERDVFGQPEQADARLGRLRAPYSLVASDPLSVIRLGSLAIDGNRFLLGTPLPSPRQRAEMAEAAANLYLDGYRSAGSMRLPIAPRRAAITNGANRPVWSSSLRMPQERFATLQRIALEQFLRKGYYAVNLDEVAKTAGVSNATVYRRFASKEGLFRFVIGERIAAIGQAPARKFESSDPDSAIAALARETLDWHVRPENIALQRLMIEMAPLLPDLARALHDTLAEVTARDLQAALRSCGLPPAGDMAARTFRSLATLGYWLIEICTTPNNAERQALSAETARIFLHGVAAAETRPGARSRSREIRKAEALRA